MTADGVQFVLVAIGMAACALMVGCRPSGAERPLAVVVSGDTAGWIVPCGCTSNQSGGLPRRAAYVEELRRQADVVVADVGGAPHGTSPYDRTKFEAILRGEKLLGIAAHNIGAAEANLGPSELRRLASSLDIPFVSANVCDRTGKRVARPLRVVRIAGHRVAIVGVLSERYATQQIQVSPPQQAVLEALHSAIQSYDTVIVLAYLPEDELRAFAAEMPEADVVLGGPTGQPIAPKAMGPTLLASATSKGKFVVRLDAPAAGSNDRWTGDVVELDGRFADDSRQLANVEQFREELALKDFSPCHTSFVKSLADLPTRDAIAGNNMCRKCHADDCDTWRKSKHAAAWNALKAKGAHVDPECQRCHTTGYGLLGGFSSVRLSEAAVDVGCESCHGPSQSHVVIPTAHTPHFGQAKNHCTTCHDRENSPTFAFDAYWRKIEHGPPSEGGKPAKTDSEKRAISQ